MLVWFIALPRALEKNPMRFLYAFSALLPMDNYACCLGALWGPYPFWDHKFDGSWTLVNNTSVLWFTLKNAVLTGDLSSLSYSFN